MTGEHPGPSGGRAEADGIDAALDDTTLAARIAAATSRLLVDLQRDRGVRPDDADHTWALKDAGDALAHTFITDALARTRPGDAVMSEEGDWSDLARLDARRLWIVDPLDATREFGIGVPDWAVQIALLEDDALTAAAFHLGARGVRWSTDDIADVEPALHADGVLTVVVSRSRAPQGLDDTIAGVVSRLRHLGVRSHRVIRVGGVGGKVDEVLQGRAQLYVGPTWCHEWDAAAPVAVAQRRSFTACDFEGQPLRFNRPDARVEGMLVGPRAIVDAWLEETGHPA